MVALPSSGCQLDRHAETTNRAPTGDARALRERASVRRHPRARLRRAEDLLLDWLGSALAGKGARPVEVDRALRAHDGSGGRSSRGADLAPQARRRSSRRWSTPPRRISPSRTTCTTARCFIRARSCFRPRSPSRRRTGASGREFITAAVAGYEVGIRVGEFLGRSHYKVFHTTGTAGTARGRSRGRPRARAFRRADARTRSARRARRRQACGNSCAMPPIPSSCTRRRPPATDLTGSVPRAGRLHRRADASSKVAQGMAAGMSTDADPRAAHRSARRALGARRNVVQVPRVVPAHASGGGRAAAARRRSTTSRPSDIARVTAHVHQAAIDVLGPGRRPADGASGEVLDGHRAGPDRDVPARRARGVRAALPRSARRARFASACGWCRTPRSKPRIRALDRQGRRRDRATAGRCRRASTSRRAIPATRCRAPSSRPRRCGSPNSSGAATPAEMRAAIARIYALADAPRVGPLIRTAAPAARFGTPRHAPPRITDATPEPAHVRRLRRARGDVGRRPAKVERARAIAEAIVREVTARAIRWMRSSTAPAPASSDSCCDRSRRRYARRPVRWHAGGRRRRRSPRRTTRTCARSSSTFSTNRFPIALRRGRSRR